MAEFKVLYMNCTLMTGVIRVEFMSKAYMRSQLLYCYGLSWSFSDEAPWCETEYQEKVFAYPR